MTCHELNDPFLSGMDPVAAYHNTAKFPPPHYHPTHHRTARPSRRAPLPHLAIEPPEADVRVSRLSHHHHPHHQNHGHHHVQAHSHHHHNPPPHQPLHHVQSHHAAPHHQAHHPHQQAHHPHHLHFAGPAKPHRRYSEHALTTQAPVSMATPATPYVNITPIFVATFTKDNFIHVCSDYLDTLTRRFADLVALPTHNEPESVFFSIAKPDIPTIEYVRRLVNYTQCSPSAFVVMLIYLDRIAAANPRLVVTPFNLHRLLLTALTLACKVLDDRCFANAHYAKVGGIRTAREMNRLELQFLHYVDFRLHVTPELYAKFERMLDNPRGPHSPRSIQHTALEMSAAGSPVSAAVSSGSVSAASMSPSPPHTSSAAAPVAVLYSNSPPRPSPRMHSVHDFMSTVTSAASSAQTPALSTLTMASTLATTAATPSAATIAAMSVSSRPSVSFDMATPTPTPVDPRHAPPAPGGGKAAHVPFARADDFYLHHQHAHHHGAHAHLRAAPHQPTLAQTRPTQSQPLPNVYATAHKRGRRASASYSADGLGPGAGAGAPYGSTWYSARA